MILLGITSFDIFFEYISMNSIIEVAEFEPGPTFEKAINDVS